MLGLTIQPSYRLVGWIHTDMAPYVCRAKKLACVLKNSYEGGIIYRRKIHERAIISEKSHELVQISPIVDLQLSLSLRFVSTGKSYIQSQSTHLRQQSLVSQQNFEPRDVFQGMLGFSLQHFSESCSQNFCSLLHAELFFLRAYVS